MNYTQKIQEIFKTMFMEIEDPSFYVKLSSSSISYKDVLHFLIKHNFTIGYAETLLLNIDTLKQLTFYIDHEQYTGFETIEDILDAITPDLHSSFRQTIIHNYETILKEVSKYAEPQLTSEQIKAYFDHFYKNPRNLDYFLLFPETLIDHSTYEMIVMSSTDPANNDLMTLIYEDLYPTFQSMIELDYSKKTMSVQALSNLLNY